MLRMGLCHFSCVSQLSFSTLIYKHGEGGMMNLLGIHIYSIALFSRLLNLPFKNFKDVSLIVIRVSTNHNRSTALSESGTVVLDEGDIHHKERKIMGKPLKERTFFFKHISLYWHGEADENCT